MTFHKHYTGTWYGQHPSSVCHLDIDIKWQNDENELRVEDRKSTSYSSPHPSLWHEVDAKDTSWEACKKAVDGLWIQNWCTLTGLLYWENICAVSITLLNLHTPPFVFHSLYPVTTFLIPVHVTKIPQIFLIIFSNRPQEALLPCLQFNLAPVILPTMIKLLLSCPFVSLPVFLI